MAEPARADSITLGRAQLSTALVGDPDSDILGGHAWVCRLDRVEEDLREKLVVAVGDADPDVGLGRFVHLGGATDLADAADRLVAGPEQPDLDQLVEMERGEPNWRGTGWLTAVQREPSFGSELDRGRVQERPAIDGQRSLRVVGRVGQR